jgi:arylsulfatase A
MYQLSSVLLLILLLASVTACSEKEVEANKSNIVLIFLDDLGYGDLGFTGQKYIETPIIDGLSEEGMVFSQFYSGSPVCAPSRSSLMTGLHTGHTHIRGNKEIDPEGQEPLLDSLVTVAEILKSAGYKTGAFGKWGLGFVGTEGDPNNQGFDSFFGYNCQRQSHRYFPDHLWDNNRRIEYPDNNPGNAEGYAPDIIQKRALTFIEDNKDEPFFLFLPYTLPHAELVVPEDSLFNKYKGKFKENPFKGTDYVIGQSVLGYSSQEYPRAAYAAMVNRIDVYVGQVIAKLKELGLEENTLIILTSDNGPAKEGGADPDFFDGNGIYKGYKRDVYEGGIHVPFIAKWPGKIASGSKSDHISALWDLLPTFSDISGASIPNKIDGVSILPTLLGKNGQKKHDYLYWEFHEQGGKQAVRKDNWKAVRLNVKKDSNGPIELYDLSKDPSEMNDIASSHPEIVKQMATYMKEAHVESNIFPLLVN